MQQAHGQGRDQRRLFRRFRQHGIARHQRSGNLAREDGQREVPRADRRDHAARRTHAGLAFGGVIAQEINGLAQFAHGVGQGLPGFLGEDGEDLAEVFFIQVRGAAQHGGAFGGRGIPDLRIGHGAACGARIGEQHLGDIRAGGRVADRVGGAGWRGHGDRASIVGDDMARRFDPGQRVFIAQVEPFRIGPSRPEQIGRCHQGGRGLRGFQRRDGIAGYILGRDGFVHDLMHKAAVRAVFQQAADQIGQQIAMRADRRIDPAAALVFADHDVMQTLAHAMQALEFEIGVADHVQNRRDRVGVMGRELRIDAVGIADQLLRIGDIADIGFHLAGEQGEVGQAFDLRALDLAVPIGALDQTHHDLAVKRRRGGIQPVDHRACALAISLHDHTKAVPTGKFGIRNHRRNDLQRQDQTVLFLGVDIHAHASGLGLAGQIADDRDQLGHHAVFLRDLVAGMQRRQLDRDAGIVADRALGAGPGNRLDCGCVFAGIAGGIGAGHRGLAQHVVAVGIALRFQRARAIQRLVDGLAQHELAAHFTHRAAGRGADHRFTQSAQRTAQGADDARLIVVQHLAGQHQRPGRGVDQRRRGLAQMAAPVGRRDLVFDQGVDGHLVGDAQHRLGQAHQGDAFAGRQPVFRQEMFHQRRLVLAADAADQIGGIGADAGARLGRQGGLGHQLLHQRRGGAELGVKREVGQGRCSGHRILRVVEASYLKQYRRCAQFMRPS